MRRARTRLMLKLSYRQKFPDYYREAFTASNRLLDEHSRRPVFSSAGEETQEGSPAVTGLPMLPILAMA